MTREQRGLFIDLMALAWDSEEPGMISMNVSQICRELGVFSATLRRFLRDFPSTWRREGGKLVQPKLREQWVKYQEISTKRSAIAKQMHVQKGGSAFAFASATAPAQSKHTTPLPPADAGEEKFFEYARQTIGVRMGRKKRLPSLECMAGSMAQDVADYLSRKGFPSRVVAME